MSKKDNITSDTANCPVAHCPSKEDLSDWYDNGNDDTVKQHVDQCEPCEQTVSFYKKVDETVRMVAVPPKYLAGDIVEACRNIEHETLVMPLWVRVARIAAVVAVVCAAAVVVNLLTNPRGGTEHPLITVTDPPSPIVLPELPKQPGTGETNPPVRIAQPDGGNQLNPVRGSDVVAVSTNGPNTGGTLDSRNLAFIAENVRHVWAVEDVKASSKALVDALPEPVKSHQFPQVTDDLVTFETAMTDAQLQQYVNTLRAEGWALVTKDFPQPDQADRVKLTGRVVKYHVEVVGKEN